MDAKITEMSGLKFFLILIISLLIYTGLLQGIKYMIEHVGKPSTT